MPMQLRCRGCLATLTSARHLMLSFFSAKPGGGCTFHSPGLSLETCGPTYTLPHRSDRSAARPEMRRYIRRMCRRSVLAVTQPNLDPPLSQNCFSVDVFLPCDGFGFPSHGF